MAIDYQARSQADSAKNLAENIDYGQFDTSNEPLSGDHLSYNTGVLQWVAPSGGINPLGSWDADINTPALVSSVGTDGDFYVVSVAGTTTLDGESVWNIGDQLIFGSTVWNRIPVRATSSTPVIITTDISVSDYTAKYVVNTSTTDITVTIPDSDASNAGLSVQIINNTGDYAVVVETVSGQNIGALTSQTIENNDEAMTITSYGNTSGYLISQDSRKSADFIDFNTSLSDVDNKVGRLKWNEDKSSLEIGINDDGVVLQVGRELLLNSCNNTLSQIDNGKVIYVSGVEDGCPEIELANSSLYNKSRALGVTTQNIATLERGEATKFGYVNGIDTSSLSVGSVYLSDSVDGGLTNTKPSGGSFVISIGQVLVSDATNGILLVDIERSELTVEVTDTNGFSSDEKDNILLEFTDVTRTFSISAISGDEYHYYQDGQKYEKSMGESIVIPDTEGLNAIYYDGETLSTILNPTESQVDVLMREKCLVSYVYWDKTNQTHNYFASEMHGISMSPITHAYLHFTRGAQYLFGYALTDMDVGGDGDVDTSAQFGVTSGMMADEDITTTASSVVSTVGLPIYYLDGANGDMRRTTNTGFSVIGDGVDRMHYNEWTGLTWQLTEVTERDFMLYHILAINGADGEDKIISVVGQNEYGNRGDARTGAEIELATITTMFPIEEAVPLATIIFETRNAFDNGVKGRVVLTDDRDDYIDWRTTELIAGAVPTDHNNLSGLQISGDGVIYGHVSSTQPFALPNMTTTVRDTFIVANGLMIYNTTTNTIQAVINGAWADI